MINKKPYIVNDDLEEELINPFEGGLIYEIIEKKDEVILLSSDKKEPSKLFKSLMNRFNRNKK